MASQRFLMLFSASGHVVVGVTAIVLATTRFVEYSDSRAESVGGGMALAAGALLLGLGGVPLINWAHHAARRQQRGNPIR